jgi:hypothetical protein
MELSDFVKGRFDEASANKLKKIRTGGDSCSKGNSFEIYYAAAKVCEIVANESDYNDFTMSAQELAFVDDLCITVTSRRHKENYQAKNSSGSAASWDADMEDRFRKQKIIDIDFHKTATSHQFLLVSSKDKAVKNNKKIPSDLKDNCSSIYFPHHNKPTRVLYSSPELKEYLIKICQTDDLSVLDLAYRCVIAAWIYDDAPRRVGDIIGRAKTDSRPNLFGSLVEPVLEIPEWLHTLCSTFQDLEARVVSGNLVVHCLGFEIHLGRNPVVPEPSVLSGLCDIGQVLSFLMSQCGKELGDAKHD